MKELITLFVSFFKIGIMTFGGGYAMLPMLEREIVTKHKWATMGEIMDYFAIADIQFQITCGCIEICTGGWPQEQQRIICVIYIFHQRKFFTQFSQTFC